MPSANENEQGVIGEKTEESRRIGREEEALLALEHTQISRATCWLLTLAFLLTIFSIPFIQTVLEIRENSAARKREASSGDVPTTGVLPHAFDALQEIPTWRQIKDVRSWSDARALIPEASRLKSHEETLEDESFISKWLLPRMQGVLLRAGVGNEQVYLGRRDDEGKQWLFYRPDVDYLTSKGFLDPALQRVRARAGDASTAAVQPDPTRAISDFHKQLAARGITLIIMPMPVKPMIEPEQLSSRYTTNVEDLQNPSYSQFLQSLRENKLLVFDPTPILLARKRETRAPQFLEADTHWKPQAMESVAEKLSEFIQANTKMRRGKNQFSARGRTAISNVGDTATMLSLLDSQSLKYKQSISIQPIFDARGEAWKSDKRAPILLLGDSFCNIYSLSGMGWGAHAGFGAQLSYHMQHPVDAVVINAGGSHTSRARLVGEMKRDRNRLQGKQVVVWEFSMRDLLIGDWKIFKLPQ